MAKKVYHLIGGGEAVIDFDKIHAVTSIGDTQCKVEMKDGTVHSLEHGHNAVAKEWTEKATKPAIE